MSPEPRDAPLPSVAARRKGRPFRHETERCCAVTTRCCFSNLSSSKGALFRKSPHQKRSRSRVSPCRDTGRAVRRGRRGGTSCPPRLRSRARGRVFGPRLSVGASRESAFGRPRITSRPLRLGRSRHVVFALDRHAVGRLPPHGRGAPRAGRPAVQAGGPGDARPEKSRVPRGRRGDRPRR